MGHATTMHAHSTGSYSLSLMLHAAVVFAVLLSAYAFRDAKKQSASEIIVLVAGEGDNYMATEAPARGLPDIETFAPPAELPAPLPQPLAEPAPQPIETPITPAPPDALVVPKTQPKTQPKKIVEPPKQQAKPMSKADFDKLYAGKSKSTPSQKAPPAKQPKTIIPPKIGAPGKGLRGGVDGGAGTAPGARGTALTAAERTQMDAYLALLIQRIKEAHEKPEGVSNELVTRVEYQVSAAGSIGAVKIIRSSGNRAFDDSVLKAFRSVRTSDIGARPDGRSSAFTADFRMKEED